MLDPNPLRFKTLSELGRPKFFFMGSQNVSLRRLKIASTTVDMRVSQSEKKAAVQLLLQVLESIGVKRRRPGGKTSP